MRRPTRTAAALAMALVAAALLVTPATAATEDSPVEHARVVEHGTTKTEYFPDDICGSRASTTTFTSTSHVVQLTERPDGSWLYHEAEVVTYISDYEDPTLPDMTGRLTEVNHFTLTPGDAFVGSVTFHDFPSGLRIYERHHLTMVGDQIIVERDLISFEGCP